MFFLILAFDLQFAADGEGAAGKIFATMLLHT